MFSDVHGKDETVPLLGMNWNKRFDTISISDLYTNTSVVTKRSILSITQRIFDPIGFTTPVTICPKIMLQNMWEKKLGWDEEVDETNRILFCKWVKELEYLKKIEIPRWINAGNKDYQSISLHTFCDASTSAYAAVIFLRIVVEESVFVHFVLAKSRVAPIKKLSVPRLELLAATIGARLYNSICENFGKDVPCFFWSDSMTVLSWIKREDFWASYVWNRTQEIRNTTDVDSWKYVPTEQNPADLPSRGCSPKYLAESKWWEGPKWLWSRPEDWPSVELHADEEEVSLSLPAGRVKDAATHEVTGTDLAGSSYLKCYEKTWIR